MLQQSEEEEKVKNHPLNNDENIIIEHPLQQPDDHELLLNDENDTPILSQYSENIIVDPFTFCLDRTNDVNLIQLNSVDIDKFDNINPMSSVHSHSHSM